LLLQTYKQAKTTHNGEVLFYNFLHILLTNRQACSTENVIELYALLLVYCYNMLLKSKSKKMNKINFKMGQVLLMLNVQPVCNIVMISLLIALSVNMIKVGKLNGS